MMQTTKPRQPIYGLWQERKSVWSCGQQTYCPRAASMRLSMDAMVSSTLPPLLSSSRRIHRVLVLQVEMIDPAVKGTLNVLQSCAKSNSVKRVVLTSSSATVRFREDIKPYEWLDESHWTSLEVCEKYQLWYAKAKVLAEKAAWEFANKNNLDLVVVLPSFVIGPVLPPDLCSTASDALGLLKGESKNFAYHGRMGYIHIDDVATAHILVFEQPSAQGRYLCSSIVLENSELAKRLAIRYSQFNIPQE